LPVRNGVDWTPQRLVWSAVLMAWGEQRTLGERFTAITTFCKSVCRHWKLGSSYDGWVQALAREEPRLLPLILGRLRQTMTVMKQRLPGQRWRALAVDGTTVVCPRTVPNQQAMGDKGKPAGMPLAALTVLFDLELGLPWAFRVGPGSDGERAHLLDMLDALDGLLVADAGFIGYQFCRQLMERQKHFLLRVGGNVHLLRALGCLYEVQGTTVYLWPAEQQQQNQPPLQLRLIVLHEGHQPPVYLVTDVLDPALLSENEASEFYRQRWGEEVFYRTAKQTFEFHTLRSRTPQNCYQELTWAMLGIWLLGLLTLDELQAAGHAPSDWSPAASRNVVRRVLRGDRPAGRSRQGLSSALRRCVKDRYLRLGATASRNYPRKKRHKPPGPPHIDMATAQQRQRAQHLTPLTTAA
jgi:Transposase DDE domain